MVKERADDRAEFAEWLARKDRRRIFWRGVWQSIASAIIVNLAGLIGYTMLHEGGTWIIYLLEHSRPPRH